MQETHRKVIEYIYLNPYQKRNDIAKGTELNQTYVKNVLRYKIDGYVCRNKYNEWYVRAPRIKAELEKKFGRPQISREAALLNYLERDFFKAFNEQLRRIDLAVERSERNKLTTDYVDFIKAKEIELDELEKELAKQISTSWSYENNYA